MSRPRSRSAPYQPAPQRAPRVVPPPQRLREAKTKGAFKDTLPRSDIMGLRFMEEFMEEFIGEGGRGLGFGLGVEDKGASEKIKNEILSPIPESEFESDSEYYSDNCDSKHHPIPAWMYLHMVS